MALLYKFAVKLFEFVIQLLKPLQLPMSLSGILSLIDLTLTVNLIIIVICSSYENFLAPIQSTKNFDRPEGLNQISFSG